MFFKAYVTLSIIFAVQHFSYADLVGSANTINTCLILSTNNVSIPVSSCVGTGRSSLLSPLLLRRLSMTDINESSGGGRCDGADEIEDGGGDNDVDSGDVNGRQDNDGRYGWF